MPLILKYCKVMSDTLAGVTASSTCSRGESSTCMRHGKKCIAAMLIQYVRNLEQYSFSQSDIFRPSEKGHILVGTPHCLQNDRLPAEQMLKGETQWLLAREPPFFVAAFLNSASASYP